VDPENRLVAAELETRWEGALRELKHAEDTYAQHQQTPVVPLTLPAELRAAFTAIGQKLPQLWHTQVLSQQQKKALLRCLIDTVVLHRATRDHVHTRLVWKGGETTTMQIPITVGSLAELSSAKAMEQCILKLSGEGTSDQEIAKQLSDLGYRSPMRPSVLPSTVQNIRLKHGLFQKRSQSHPRAIPGYLTVPQLAQTLDISRHWVYDRIHNRCIHISKDVHTGLYLFPDTPATREMFNQLMAGILHNLRFS
jgi:predicted DNA-binding transcriptional regulator AlpA